MIQSDKLQQTQYKLQEAINSQNAVFSAIPDLMFELDINGRYINIWASNPQELAASKKELLGYTVSEKLPDDAGKEVMNAITEARDTGNSFGRQIYIDTLSGKLWFELSVSKKDNIGLSNTFIIISRNITDRKLNEEKLEQLSERLTLALLGNKEGVWDWSLLDNSVYFSPRCKEIIGYQDNEISNDFFQWKRRIHPEDLPKVLKDIQENIDGKSEYVNNVHRLKHKDGHWVWIHVKAKAIFDINGKAIRIIGTHTDITQEKKQQYEIYKQAQIIEQIHDSIISTDLHGYILTWNQGSQEMLGYTDKEVIGQHMSILHRPQDIEKNKEYATELMTRESFSVESYLVSKSKKHIPVMVSLSLLKDESGNPVGLIGISQDITHRKEIEKELALQRDILSHQAHHDVLTGLKNRLTLERDIENLIAQYKENSAPYAVLMLDIDYNSYNAYQKDPNPEHRLFFVGITRTVENLYLVNPMGEYGYQI